MGATGIRAGLLRDSESDIYRTLLEEDYKTVLESRLRASLPVSMTG